MKATAELRREHASILRRVSILNGLAASRMTREVAEQTCKSIRAIDGLLVEHLRVEDEMLYPTLIAAQDGEIRRTAESWFHDMSGILGAWIAYRDHWTLDNVLANTDRFRAATTGILGALAIRIENENRELYPLLDSLSAEAGNAELID